MAQQPKKQIKPSEKLKGKPSQSTTWFSILLFMSAFILYGNTLSHQFTLDDDVVYLKNSTVQKGIQGIGSIFTEGSLEGFGDRNGNQPYRPITLTTFALEKEFTGNNPRVAHFLNVLLYALLSIVVFRFLNRLFPDSNIYFHGLMVLLFMAHPVHTEVVASIKSRDELLAALFGLTSISLVIPKHNKETSIQKIILAGFLFLLACLSKESSITLTGILVLILFIKNKESKNIILSKLFSFLLFTVLFLLFRWKALPVDNAPKDVIGLDNILMTAANVGELIATKLEILFYYLRLLFVPYPLSWDYSINQIPIKDFTSAITWISITIHLSLLVLVFFWIRKRTEISFGILFYFITFALTNNLFISFATTVAERLLFLPSLGFIIVCGYGFSDAFKVDRKLFTGTGRSKFMGVFLIIIVLFSILTINRNKDWATNYTLYKAGVEASPNSSRTNALFASELRKLGESEKVPQKRFEYFSNAVNFYQRSIDIYPKNVYALYNLGVTYTALADTDKALFTYHKAINIDSGEFLSFMNLGVLYGGRGQYDSSLIYLHRGNLTIPNNPQLLSNLTAIYFFKGDYENALKYGKEVVRLSPANKQGYDVMYQILHTMGRENEAMEYIKMYQDRSPKF